MHTLHQDMSIWMNVIPTSSSISERTLFNQRIRIQRRSTGNWMDAFEQSLIVLLLLCFPFSSFAVPISSRQKNLLQTTVVQRHKPPKIKNWMKQSTFGLSRIATACSANNNDNNNNSSSRTKDPNKNNKNNNSKNQAWLLGVTNAMASACAAACCKTLLQPIDAMKTVQQYHRGTLTLMAAARLLWERPGRLANFYAGLGVTVVGAMPSVGIYFGVYSYCKHRFLQSSLGKERPTLSIALSAAIGNTVASFSRVPYEVAKQNLQMGLYDSTWSLWRDLWKPGMAADLLFPKGGVWVQMVRDVPYAIVTLLLYESLQRRQFGGLNNNNNIKSKPSHPSRRQQSHAALPRSPLRDALIGGFAGGIGSWVTNPMDVIKTRLQTDSVLYGGSIVQCATAVWHEGGATAFLRGSLPRLLHKVPANALFFLFYEFFQRLIIAVQ